MTALKQYERLAATGRWRETPQAQRRDVIVSFGTASLILRDSHDTALTHWSLPAIERLNPGKRPALFQPGPDAGETLEVDDASMIDAIEKIRRSIAQTRPHHGRLRFAVLLGSVAIIAALGVFWLPGALVRHTISVVPDSTRSSIGTALLGHVTRLTGDTCQSQLGLTALARLKARVVGDRVEHTYIIPDAAQPTLMLPGRKMLLNRRLVEDHDLPDVAAGYMLAALANPANTDPLEKLLRDSGTGASFQLLTTGKLDDATLSDYAETLVTSDTDQAQSKALIDRFTAAKISTSPYAYAIDVTGETTFHLIEADPFRGTPSPQLLSDGDWISLQAICGE
jgi:hypothetical protein